jgi:excisionase family DNA binding protein
MAQDNCISERIDVQILYRMPVTLKGGRQMPNENSPAILTVGELARYLRVHRSTIYRLLKKGELPAFKIGSDWRFNTSQIDRWRLEQSPS